MDLMAHCATYFERHYVTAGSPCTAPQDRDLDTESKEMTSPMAL